MTDRDKRDEVPDVFEGGDNGTAVPTGVGTQQLVIDGWSASRADTGVAGPHLALGITNGKRAVVHVRQVPALVAALSEIAIRMTQEWEWHGRSWLEEVGASAARVPEPEPAEERLRRRLAKAELMDVIVDRTRSPRGRPGRPRRAGRGRGRRADSGNLGRSGQRRPNAPAVQGADN